jgi:hypothetical protein
MNSTTPSADKPQVCIYSNLSRGAGITIDVAHGVVLCLSLALIVFISYDTFAGIPFLENKVYMTFQFWVCMIFMADFFLELALSHNKRRYLWTRSFFFIISIPYLNILAHTDIHLSSQALYFIRFIPLVRGAYSLAMVVGYFSDNKATNILASYAAILFSIIYFASLIFFNQEKNINPDVKDYWDALWWACMNVTTIGCYINPLSIAGKICGATLAGCGMLMLPLFTVYVTSLVKNHKEHTRRVKTLIETAIDTK